MALLGKTLKGRSTRPGGVPQKQNIQVRQIAKTQQEFDQMKQLSKLKREALKAQIKEEQKFVNFNKKKLLTYWRKIMRIAQTEQLKNEIEIYQQNNQRELDSQEAFIQMLDQNLDEAEDQYQIALRNHLIHIQNLISLQNARLRGLQQEFDRDIQILEDEYEEERRFILNMQRIQMKQLQDMIDTVKEEEKRKSDDARNDFQAFKEEVKNKNMEETNHMKMMLDAKQNKHYNELEQMHQKYVSDTAKKTETHTNLFDQNKAMGIKIDSLLRSITNKQAKIDLMKLKILQHTKQCNARNLALEKEKKHISKNYHELKEKMLQFREDQSRLLKELTNNSRNAVLTLTEYCELGQKILKTAELCRRLETEKEKVLPFYEGTVDPIEIPEELRNQFEELSQDKAEEFAYLNNFYKRYNQVLLDQLAIEKQKEALQQDNALLQSLLKQYLDGISLNDDVLQSNNPLLVVNHQINISRPPIEQNPNQTKIEGALAIQTINMQMQGAPVPQFSYY